MTKEELLAEVKKLSDPELEDFWQMLWAYEFERLIGGPIPPEKAVISAGAKPEYGVPSRGKGSRRRRA